MCPRLSSDVLLGSFWVVQTHPSLLSGVNSVAGRQTLPLPCLLLPLAKTMGAFLVLVCEVGLTDPLGDFKTVTSTLIEASLGSVRSQERVTLGRDALLSVRHSLVTK